MTEQDIHNLLANGECVTLECKKARNQSIQNMLRMIGYGENLGSGFPLILSAWNEKHWLKPELIEQPELMQVKLVLHIETMGNVTKEGIIIGIKELLENMIVELI